MLYHKAMFFELLLMVLTYHHFDLANINPFNINPINPNATFLHPLKKSENFTVFWCFQVVEKECIRKKLDKHYNHIFSHFPTRQTLLGWMIRVWWRLRKSYTVTFSKNSRSFFIQTLSYKIPIWCLPFISFIRSYYFQVCSEISDND